MRILFLAAALLHPTFAHAGDPPLGRMGQAGDLLFSEDFDPGSVSPRWFFREHFTIENGALIRSPIPGDDAKRIFLKDASFGDVIIRFDFKLDGADDLRLVTGGGGSYNSIIQIRPSHFQLNTPVDRDAGFVPCYLGECAHTFKPGTWHTMTVEYSGDQILAWTDEKHFVVGSHPIIDRTRTYFAFQVDRPSAAIDNVSIWETEPRDDWPERRARLRAQQTARPAVARDPADRYDYIFTILKSRLHRNDAAYRDLVAKHARLQAALHESYPDAFRTHKELQKSILKERARFRKDDPDFKPLQNTAHKAAREVEAYVKTKFPDLEGLPDHRYYATYQKRRTELETAGDAKLSELVGESAGRQSALEKRFPAAFGNVETLVAKRNEIRRALNGDPEFSRRNKEVAEALRAIRDYQNRADPRLPDLEAARKAYLESRK